MTQYDCPKVRELEEANRNLRQALQESILLEGSKPVVWVREYGGSFYTCNSEGKRCTFAASYATNDIGEVYRCLSDVYGLARKDIDVRVWEEPEPEHVWVYGVWKGSLFGSFCAHKNNLYTDSADTIEKAIPLCLNTVCGGDAHARETPIFGVRRLTEGEIELVLQSGMDHSQYADEGRYGAFYNGKLLKNTFSVEASKSVKYALLRLTPAVPAKPAVTLADLEVVKS